MGGQEINTCGGARHLHWSFMRPSRGLHVGHCCIIGIDADADAGAGAGAGAASRD